jgi:hypothetical protein
MLPIWMGFKLSIGADTSHGYVSGRMGLNIANNSVGVFRISLSNEAIASTMIAGNADVGAVCADGSGGLIAAFTTYESREFTNFEYSVTGAARVTLRTNG